MRQRKFVYPFLYFFLQLASSAAYLPYMVLYYHSLSFTGVQIGLLTGITPLITLVSLPLITGLADKTKKHKLVMSLSLLFVVSGIVVIPFLNRFILVFILIILLNVFFSPIGPLSNSATMFMLGDRKELYGRIRLGGTIGFSIAAAAVGVLVENFGLKIAFWTAAGLLFIAFFVSQNLVHGTEESVKPADMKRVFSLLKDPRFLLLLLMGLVGGIANRLINSFLFPYMSELGARESIMGIAMTIGTIAELPILFFVSRFIKKYKAFNLLIVSTAVTCLRFLLLAVTENPILVLVIQLLNGFTFPLLTVAGVTYAEEHAPAGFRATSQGLFNTFSLGIGSAVGGVAGGFLFESVGARGMYLSFFIFVALVLVLVYLVRGALPPKQESEEAIQ